jgi:hypothetical protein
MRDARARGPAPRLAALALLGLSLLLPPEAASSNPPGAEDERPLDAEPFPAEATKLPTAAEWTAAPRVRLSRRGPAAEGCRAYRLREWLRVRCPDLTIATISLLGGQTEGVAFWITPSPEGSGLPRGGEVMFPVRRGDRRVVQITTFGAGYDGPFTILPAVIIQEQWLDGDPAPIISAM